VGHGGAILYADLDLERSVRKAITTWPGTHRPTSRLKVNSEAPSIYLREGGTGKQNTPHLRMDPAVKKPTGKKSGSAIH